MSEWKPASEMPGGTVTSGTGGLKNMFEREIDKQVKAEAGMNFGPNKCVAFGDKIRPPRRPSPPSRSASGTC